MENTPADVKSESIEFFQSTIRKSEKALAQMTGKAVSTSLVEKRLKAFHIGLTVLEKVWHDKPHLCSQAELARARKVLTGLLPSIKSVYAKAEASSPQRTLLDRRIKSVELAIVAIDDLSM